MQKAFKYRLYPTKKQERTLFWTLTRCRELYNAGAQSGYSLTQDHRVCLSKIGSIKVKLHRAIKGTIKTATIKHEAGQWYIIFACEIEPPEALPTGESEVGIDLGVTHFAALSVWSSSINGAAAQSGLAKSILDAGWGQFLQMCVAKAGYAGPDIIFVNPRYTSQVCSQCGTIRKQSQAERWHSCECGCELDR